MDSGILSSPTVDQDWLWIKKIQAGDAAAFQEIFQKYKSQVIRLAFRFVRHRETAEDIAQKVFLKVYEGKVRFDPKAKFSTWLYRVTVNASLDAIRRKEFLPWHFEKRPGGEESERPFEDELAAPEALRPDAVLERSEIERLVQKALSRLPEKFRHPILLYQFQEMPYREIALILGITEKAVERRIARAKALLRKSLAKYL